MKRADLEKDVKELIVSALELEDVMPDDIKSAEPLFVEGLGLDSIDALELGMALKKKYQLNFKSGSEENRKHFYSVDTIVDYIINDKGQEF
jgi:acyl carrier protein